MQTACEREFYVTKIFERRCCAARHLRCSRIEAVATPRAECAQRESAREQSERRYHDVGRAHHATLDDSTTRRLDGSTAQLSAARRAATRVVWQLSVMIAASIHALDALTFAGTRARISAPRAKCAHLLRSRGARYG